jgi:hypothetical protein
MKNRVLTLTFIVFSLITGCSQRSARVMPGEPALADFDRRIKAYAALRDEMEKGNAQLAETKSPSDIAAAEKALALKMQSARKTAKRGDIFTPEIEQRFRALLNPELKGTQGRNTRGIIFDEAPTRFAFKVNSAYPKEEPLGTVPPNILQTLPPLPEGIEYRFISTHLILRDSRANLIIDFIPGAIA